MPSDPLYDLTSVTLAKPTVLPRKRPYVKFRASPRYPNLEFSAFIRTEFVCQRISVVSVIPDRFSNRNKGRGKFRPSPSNWGTPHPRDGDRAGVRGINQAQSSKAKAQEKLQSTKLQGALECWMLNVGRWALHVFGCGFHERRRFIWPPIGQARLGAGS